jgi:GT2 family glycosyltransferase
MLGCSDPSLSVIVATCNRDEVLCTSLSRILEQDYAGDWELIVVDQSESHSDEVRTFLERNAARINYVRQDEPNLPKARNAGFRGAMGKLIVLVDDDMLLPTDTLTRFAKHFASMQRRAVAGIAISERDPERSLRLYMRRYGRGVSNGVERLLDGSRYIPSPLCLPASAFQLVGGYDSQLGALTPAAYAEDYDFAYRLWKVGVRLFLDPLIRVAHLDHVAGGCGSRHLDPAVARRYQVMAMAYLAMKRHGTVGVRGWANIYRGYVLNRETLRSGCASILRRFRQVRAAVSQVQDVYSRNQPLKPCSKP